MIKKKKILIFYDWFYPGFKAGGPIQSLTNLCALLIPFFDVNVITSAYDLNSSAPYDRINIDSWNSVVLPACNHPINIYYAKKELLTKKVLISLITELSPSIIYLNGIFSYRFFLLPLLILKRIDKNVKVVLCPRGMLTEGALSGKAFKKKIYINYLRLSGLTNNVNWHATSPKEAEEIKTHFNPREKLLTAANIPKKPLFKISVISKNAGELSLVYLSLINQHKNLLLLLQLLKEMEREITLDIFGPIVEENYWKQCENLINQMSAKIKYKGSVQPRDVQDVLSEYHAFILFTKGENFGHALYESLSVGRPVITSHYTPWQDLENKTAGANVDYLNSEECKEKLNQFINMPQDEYNKYCEGAHALATNHYNDLKSQETYLDLFS